MCGIVVVCIVVIVDGVLELWCVFGVVVGGCEVYVGIGGIDSLFDVAVGNVYEIIFEVDLLDEGV